MKDKHTPGPWHIGMKPGPIVYGPLGEQVALMQVPMLGEAEHRANARLIAAAPELLAALQWFTAAMHDDSVDDMGTFINEMESRARAAINKAKGE